MSILKSKRIVELSHRMVPGEEEFPLEIETFNADEVMAKTARGRAPTPSNAARTSGTSSRR